MPPRPKLAGITVKRQSMQPVESTLDRARKNKRKHELMASAKKKGSCGCGG